MKKIAILALLYTLVWGSSCKSSVATIKANPETPKDFATNFLINERIPGMAITVAKHGDIIWSEGFGYANIAKKIKVKPDETQFRIASISKPISAVCMATLIDAKLIDLDSSVYAYLPTYPKKKYDFTIRQVGGHTAGIRHYKNNEFLLNEPLTITQGIDIFKNDTLLFKPQSNYKYSTYGWNLLSEVTQTVAKTPFDTYTKNVIFSPLKMLNTSLDYCNTDIPNRTLFYRKNENGKIELGSPVCNEFKAAGGGFISTSEDLIKFGNEIIHPTLISKTVLSELLTPQILDSGKNTHYGVGFSVDLSKNKTPRFGHSGGGVGASTLLLIYPEEEVVISIVTNLSNVPVYDLGNQLEALFIN
ncbi:serine hydrolase domain-containing protein [Neotamlana laminarinivorans]|uniref:Beta-lactamase family protein n=1 Tax=Neotamlana laminarinivorans TaxID=2883124 RepID=A0A9X1L290_9FLAO|nr:serine hydrolase domain-containing protein [Tamlana laminarinivorans]MCB4799543.1 beta-lactamase family protein [Tamlana laminarinivorans]